MRLRISSLIFGLSIFLASIILLYQILSLPTESPASFGKKPENVAYLESRLRKLEEDIVTNHATIKQIKKLIQGLSESKDVDNLLVDELMEKSIPDSSKSIFTNLGREFVNLDSKMVLQQPTYNLSKALVQVDDCIFSQSSPSMVDIQMMNLYDILPFNNPDGGPWKQGWRVQYNASQWSKDNKLKVFVVPHSHNDPGWIKTFEKYFEDQTCNILDNMVVKLGEDHRRKFIWAEISFFSLWWDRQTMEVKDSVRRLVERGQLEIVTGGWVMPDEANTHYYSLIDQLLTGHEWLQLNLGTKPNNGWSIDPFGMSPTMAYLLKKAGLQNMLIQRTHYSIKKHLAKEKNLEFQWRQIWDTQKSTDMLCHMMPFYGYDVPHTCGPDPKVCCQFDFRRLPGSGVTCPWRISPQPINSQNVDARARLILDQYRKKAQLYRTNVLLVPLGDDFRYVSSTEWDNQFLNYQQLFDHMNSHDDLHVQAQFGTLADYFRALREEVEKKGKYEETGNFFPSLSGDFFSYADRDKSYWTGYFTSRPFYKRMNRVLQAYLRSAEILFSLMLETETHSGWTRNQQEVVYTLMDHLVQIRRHHGLFQHHDGITGTAKNHVVVDYANKMLSGLRMSEHVIQQAVNSLLSMKPLAGNEDATNGYFELGETFPAYNALPEVTVRRVSVQSPFIVYIFNPDAHKRQQLITIRIDTPFVQVKDRSGELLLCQIEPVFRHAGDPIAGQYDLHFLSSLDALSITAFIIESVPQDKIQTKYTFFSMIEYRHFTEVNIADVFPVIASSSKEEPILLQVGHVSANFSSLGLLQQVSLNGQSMNASLSFVKYDGGSGGAYLFLPRGVSQEMKLINLPLIIVRGPLTAHLTLEHDILKHQVILKNSPGADGLSIRINNFVDIKKQRNVELSMRLRTSIKNENVFYTDLNGFQIIKRVRYEKFPLQANVYPMPSQMFIEDQNKRLTLLSSQPLGCASFHSGEIEVFQDRQLAQDDERGLGHGVHDNVLTLNSFLLLLESKSETRESALRVEIPSGFPSLTVHTATSYLLYPVITMHSLTKDKEYSKHWSPGGELPCDVELVNLRSLTAPRQPGALHPPSSTIALTLRRLGFSCSLPALGLYCSTNNGKIRLSDLFPASFSDQVKQMSLSHLYEGIDMSKSYTLSLHPMELYSFKLFISSGN